MIVANALCYDDVFTLSNGVRLQARNRRFGSFLPLASYPHWDLARFNYRPLSAGLDHSHCGRRRWLLAGGVKRRIDLGR